MTYIDPFQNPVGLAAARAQTTSGFSTYGPDLWDIITAISTHNEPFKATTVAEYLAKQKSLSWGTAYQYTRAFIAYARACPEEFTGPASRITKDRHGRFYLADGPEELQ
jgi:hypothetical protein